MFHLRKRTSERHSTSVSGISLGQCFPIVVSHRFFVKPPTLYHIVWVTDTCKSSVPSQAFLLHHRQTVVACTIWNMAFENLWFPSFCFVNCHYLLDTCAGHPPKSGAPLSYMCSHCLWSACRWESRRRSISRHFCSAPSLVRWYERRRRSNLEVPSLLDEVDVLTGSVSSKERPETFPVLFRLPARDVLFAKTFWRALANSSSVWLPYYCWYIPAKLNESQS